MITSRGAFSGRSIAIGLALAPVTCLWLVYMERVRNGPFVSSISLFATAVSVLVLISICNYFCCLRWPGRELTRAEMLSIYGIVALTTAIGGMDFVQILMMTVAYPGRYGAENADWARRVLPLIPQWLVVQDADAIKGFYRGADTLYRGKYLLAWMPVIGAWTLFVSLLLWTTLCSGELFRRRWTQQEHLSFPLTVIPVELASPRLDLFCNRLFWLGFLPAAGLCIWNGLAFLNPAIPAIPVGQYWQLQTMLTTKPWDGIGWTPVTFYPFCIGLGLLLPVDLLFSCWFFYLFWKAERVVTRAMAWDLTPGAPFIEHQVFGALLALVAAAVWAARLDLGRAFRLLCRRGDAGAVPAWAARGWVLGTLGMFLFLMAAGMSPAVAALFLIAYLMISIGVARIRAELGPPVHDFHYVGPDVMTVSMLGAPELGQRNLTALSMFWWFNRAYRSHPIPVQMETMHTVSTPDTTRRAVWVLMLAGLVGTVCACWAFLHLAYSQGAAAKMLSPLYYGSEVMGRLTSWIDSPPPVNANGNWAILGGALMGAALSAARATIPGWPLHPIGLAISGTWSMNLVWMPLLIAWVIKATVLKWGGLRLYRTVLPLFLGVVLGDLLVGSLWGLVGMILGVETYSFWGA